MLQAQVSQWRFFNFGALWVLSSHMAAGYHRMITGERGYAQPAGGDGNGLRGVDSGAGGGLALLESIKRRPPTAFIPGITDYVRSSLALLRGEDGLYLTLEDSPLHSDAAPAPLAPEADVGPHPHHLPLVAATGVLLLEPHYVARSYLHSSFPIAMGPATG